MSALVNPPIRVLEVIGNAIVPVIKICANPRTVRLMSEHIDVDTSGLLQREITLDQAGDRRCGHRRLDVDVEALVHAPARRVAAT